MNIQRTINNEAKSQIFNCAYVVFNNCQASDDLATWGDCLKLAWIRYKMTQEIFFAETATILIRFLKKDGTKRTAKALKRIKPPTRFNNLNNPFLFTFAEEFQIVRMFDIRRCFHFQNVIETKADLFNASNNFSCISCNMWTGQIVDVAA